MQAVGKDVDRLVVERLFDLSASGRQVEMPKCMHPELRIRTYLPPNDVLDGEGFAQYIEERSHDHTREARAHRIESLGGGRYLVTGRVRWSLRGGGFTDSPAFWAIAVKDELIYRLYGALTVEEALSLLNADDLGLGLEQFLSAGDGPGAARRLSLLVQQSRRATQRSGRLAGHSRALIINARTARGEARRVREARRHQSVAR